MKLRNCYSLAAIVFGLLAAFGASAQVMVFQSGVSPSEDYKGVESTFIQITNPRSLRPNEMFFGTNGSIINVNRVRGLLSFDISALPANAQIKSVSLTLTLNKTNDRESGDKQLTINLMGMVGRFEGVETANWENSSSLYYPEPVATASANPFTASDGEKITFSSGASNWFTAFTQDALDKNKGKLNLMLKLSDADEVPDPTLADNQRYTFRGQPARGRVVEQRPVLTIEYTLH